VTLKSACKTAIVLAIISVILILAGRVLTSISVFIQISGAQNGWSAMPHTPRYTILVTQLFQIIPIVLYRGLLLAGFITLLSACLKRHNDPQANVRTRFIIAAILTGLGTLITLAQSVSFYYTIFRHSLPMNSQLCLSIAYFITTALCGVTLCVFAAVCASGHIIRTPTIAAIVCHFLRVFIFAAGLINTMYAGLIFLKSPDTYSPMFIASWFAASLSSHIGLFLWLAAVLLFLFAYLKNLPPQAGVIELSPEPTP